MALTGQAKIDYQREYMRKRRSNATSESVRPSVTVDVRPIEPGEHIHIEDELGLESDDNGYEEPEPRRLYIKKGSAMDPTPYPLQSHNSMMVGYVPPAE